MPRHLGGTVPTTELRAFEVVIPLMVAEGRVQFFLFSVWAPSEFLAEQFARWHLVQNVEL